MNPDNPDMVIVDVSQLFYGAAVAEWLSSWLAEQEDRGSIPGLATWIFRDWLSPASKSRYGWKIAKSTLILKTTNQPTHLFYHIVWPFGGKPSDLVESIKERLNHYPNESKKAIVFDKYENISAKDHERKRRADEVVINYEISISSKLPKCDAIM